ncbi:MAG: hypothetical protein UR51_C0010G0051 [Candidatus Moranbacteria bacterium GW2011_GWF1_34_10]|nr:MAG: hypothetical protein UR51_C0010G0051 [Candidatus Moranbacteria bacterium GW2011_GWF1_34_10]
MIFGKCQMGASCYFKLTSSMNQHNIQAKGGDDKMKRFLIPRVAHCGIGA